MTKQHFIRLADMIRNQNATDARFTQEQINALADFLASENPRFNRGRWLAYVAGECGPNGGAR